MTTIPAQHPFPLSTNSNCLAGVRCPRCGHETSFDITATTTATITDDGTDDTTGTEYDASAHTQCTDCSFTGMLALFMTDLPEHQRAAAHLTAICAEAGLSSFRAVLDFVIDRDQVPDAALLALTEQDITDLYDGLLAPAVDLIEGALLHRV